jgi:glycosyltransferase involved in cell wall biosynthesis
LAEALEKLLDNPVKREKPGLALQTAVRENFSIQKITAEYEKLY